MNDDNEFYKEIPFLINGEKQYCEMCNRLTLIGDYVEIHLTADCMSEVLLCRKCLLKNGFVLKPKLTIVNNTFTIPADPNDVA
jgi:hypothetical protein